MPLPVTERTPVPIGPLDFDRPHDPDALLIYRGYAIAGAADGWDVLDPTSSTPLDEQDIGWGATLYDAMSVVNENVDGCERRKAA